MSGWEDFFGSLPIVGPIVQGRRTDRALGKQEEALSDAERYQSNYLTRAEGMYQPLIQMGQGQLRALHGGIAMGDFGMDESIFRGYEPFVAANYIPADQFQYQRRTPFTETPSQPIPFEMQNEWKAQPFQYGQQVQPFNYQGQQVQQYNPAQLPSPWQGPQEPKPDIYRSGNSPNAQYYSPDQQYQQRPFNLQDDPVYQRRIKEGNEAIEASAAARGMQLSGSTLKALQENASDIAAEEGQAAWGRHMTEDQTGYNRFQDQQNRVQNAMQYRSEDEYRRYLDSVGIRSGEQDRLVNQWYQDRGFSRDVYTGDRDFSQQAGVQNYLTGLQGQGQAWNQANTGYLTGLAGQGQGYNQALSTAGFNAGQGQQNFNNAMTVAGYNAGQGQQYWQNLMDAYNVGNQNYNFDVPMQYGMYRDSEGDRYNQYLGNLAQRNYESGIGYGLLTDAYGRQLTNRQNQYGMIGDLVNMGMGAGQNLMGAYGDYYGGMTDIGIQGANAYAAAQQAKNANSDLLNWLGI